MQQTSVYITIMLFRQEYDILRNKVIYIPELHFFIFMFYIKKLICDIKICLFRNDFHL